MQDFTVNQLCAADLMELELKVEGMVCDGCSTRVADALKASKSWLVADTSVFRNCKAKSVCVSVVGNGWRGQGRS